ncbi:MAG: iron-containing alcohol dehydrogenase, partial [Planctomycetaceae bacterium]
MLARNTVWQFSTAANIRFGRGSHTLLVAEIQRLGIERPLIIVDQTIAELPMISELFRTLKSSIGGVSIYDECVPEPSVAIAEAAIAHGRAAGSDGVIGIGGGSNLDVAKIA